MDEPVHRRGCGRGQSSQLSAQWAVGGNGAANCSKHVSGASTTKASSAGLAMARALARELVTTPMRTFSTPERLSQRAEVGTFIAVLQSVARSADGG